jgi:tetratricopeptide (TPR) repeat protein
MREQHRRIVEMRATANVLRAAQQDLDAADAAAGVADEAHRRARADQAAASRAASAAAETLEGFFAEALRTTAVPRAIPVGAELLRPRTGGVSSQKPDAVGPGAVDDAPREPLVAVRDGESPGLDDGATPDRPEPPLQAQSAPGESPAASANPFVGRRAAIAVGVALVATAVVAGVMVSDPRTPSMSAAAESAAADSGAAQDAVSAPPPGWAPGNTPAQDAQLDADFKVCSGPALHEAVAACTRMIAAGRLMTADKLSAVRTWRGLALDKLGRRKDALSDHLVALALAPDSAAYANVGREYNDLGDYGLASQYLHQALMLDPANLGAKRELAFAHRHDRAPEAADESSAGARSTSAR